MSEALDGIREYLGQFPEHDQADVRLFFAAEALAQCEAKLKAMEQTARQAGWLDARQSMPKKKQEK